MATTTNFGWETPDDTDLVKDGAAAIRTALGGVDTSFVDLKGGTTGQVLSKASNTDLDFSWVAQDDSNAIQNAIVDAKGDLIAATAADTPARLAVGANDTVLTADSSTATGLKWAASSSGGMTSIASGTLSGSSVVISSISGTYKNLQLIVRNFKPTTTQNNLVLRINGNSGTVYQRSTSLSQSNATFGETAVDIGESGQQNAGTSLALHIVNFYDYANATTRKIFDILSYQQPSTQANINAMMQYAVTSQTDAITSLTLFSGSGNLTSGDYILYGVK